MENKSQFVFEKENYMLMILGVVVILLGFLVMSMDKTLHGFGFLGLTLGPVITFVGFVIEMVAILYKPKPKS